MKSVSHMTFAAAAAPGLAAKAAAASGQDDDNTSLLDLIPARIRQWVI